MGLNDDRLSDREHSEMRDTVLAGTQRIKPAGAHRAQLIAAAVALVLVGGITGGAITTAALLGSGPDTIASTPTPTVTAEPSPTPEPTPEPTVEPEPAPAAAFGGECGNVLTDAEASAATGKTMGPLAAAWSPGADTRIGGLSCGWTTTGGEYMGAEVRVEAYPVGAAEAAGVASPESCEEQEFRAECTFAATTHSLWLRVSVSRSEFEGAAVDTEAIRAATQNALDLVVQRAGEYPTPRAVDVTPEWWTLDSCSAIAADLEAAGAIATGAAVYDALTELDEFSNGVVPVRLGVSRWCSLEGGQHFLLWPGAADVFDEVAALDASEPLTVPGAQAAVLAPSLDAYEGHYPLVLVSDGVNLLGVSLDDFDGVQQSHLDFAAALLQVMSER